MPPNSIGRILQSDQKRSPSCPASKLAPSRYVLRRSYQRKLADQDRISPAKMHNLTMPCVTDCFPPNASNCIKA
jgi:hypothetical protein